MTKFISAIMLIVIGAAEVGAEEYRPTIGFSVERAGLEESLTFIAGALYSIAEHQNLARAAGRESYPCILDSAIRMPVALSVLNERLSGEVESERVVKTLFEGLIDRYQCE